MIVQHIDFETIKQFWIDVNHFNEPDKKIVEIIKRLGKHRTFITNPKRISYGLFNNNNLIGVTHLVRWSDTHVRYRTLHILKEYRGNDLGWYLLKAAYKKDWQGEGNLFGWIRNTHYLWAKNHGFVDIDSTWTDNHIAMERNMTNE
jgi:hypothetical protein